MVLRTTGLTVRISRVLAPITVLGPGSRLVVWVQGCDLACVGCASVDTWDRAGGREVGVTELSELVSSEIRARSLDGITLTGGEPTDQALALTRVIRAVRSTTPDQHVDVLLFTGRTLTSARRLAPALVGAADCVVAGPYRPDRTGTGRLLASSNQSISYASEAARGRYESWLADDTARLQLAADDRDLYIVGLPAPGTLDSFAARLSHRGVVLDQVTWRP